MNFRQRNPDKEEKAVHNIGLPVCRSAQSVTVSPRLLCSYSNLKKNLHFKCRNSVSEHTTEHALYQSFCSR